MSYEISYFHRLKSKKLDVVLQSTTSVISKTWLVENFHFRAFP